MAAATSALSSIGSLSSSSPLSLLPSDHSFTIFAPSFTPPNPIPRPPKILLLKSPNLTLSPLPLLFPLSHRCHSTAFFNDTNNSISDVSKEGTDEEDQEAEEQDEIEEIVRSDPVDDCRVYIGNLPFSMTSSELSETFAEAGRVRCVEVFTLPFDHFGHLVILGFFFGGGKFMGN